MVLSQACVLTKTLRSCFIRNAPAKSSRNLRILCFQATLLSHKKERAHVFLSCPSLPFEMQPYFQALDLRPGDKNCLVARAQCYLELGNADAALADAEATLSDDKNFIQVKLLRPSSLA